MGIFKLKKSFLLCILGYMLANNMLAQVQKFTDKQGLSQNSIYSIIQDTKGRIWVSTGDGMCVYDGNRFRTVSINNKDLTNRNIFPGRFHYDSFGNIWIGGLPGIFRVSQGGNLVENFAAKLGLDSAANTYVMSCSDEHLYFVSNGVKLIKFNLVTGQQYQFDITQLFDSFTQCYKVFEVDSGFLLATNKGLFRYRNGGILECLHRCNCKPEAFKIDRNRFIYCDDNIWEFEISNNGFKKYQVLKNILLQDITDCFSHKNKIYLASRSNGLYILKLSDLTILNHLQAGEINNNLPFNLFSAVFVDHNDQLWVGSDGEGLVRLNLNIDLFNHQFISNSKLKIGESPNFIKCFYEDPSNGQIWVGSYSGLYKWDGRKGLTLSKFNGIEGNIVSNIQLDKRKRLWAATERGIFLQKENGRPFEKIPFPAFGEQKFSGECIYSMDANGSAIYFATKFGVAVYDEKRNSIEIYALKDHLIKYVFNDIQDNLWVTDYYGDLFLLKQGRPGVAVNPLFKKYGIRHVIYDIKLQRYLAASNIGLIILKKDYSVEKILNTENVLISNILYGILKDNNNRYWLSSNKGIMCLDLKQLKIRNFSTADGLQSQEFNTGAYLKTKKGNLFFGGINGFNYFNPDSVMQLRIHGDICLLSCKVMNESRWNLNSWNGSILKLPYDSNTLELNFMLPDFIDPESVTYYYKLGNESKSWISLGSNPKIFLTNLKPGKYVLWVKAMDHFGMETQAKQLIVFSISSPFYLKWWFILLITVLAGTLVFGIIRYLYVQKLKVALETSRRQQEVQQLRLNISRELHDNLGSSLSRVALLSHKMRQMPEKTNIAETADSISKLTSELNGQVRNIVWSLDHAYDNLEGLATHIRQFALGFLEENGIQANVYIPLNLPVFKVRPDVRQVLYSITKEALNNAVKYSQSKTIDVRFTVNSHGEFELLIQDYGIGFDTSLERKFSHGLKNMVLRTSELGFEAQIISAKNKGTELRITGDLNIPHS